MNRFDATNYKPLGKACTFPDKLKGVRAIKRRNPEQDYMELLNSIEGKLVTFKELHDSSFERPEKCFVIRHDVDKSIRQAIAMATLEANFGIKSTYFLLPSASYWTPSITFLNQAWELKMLGHDVGIHLNAITQQILCKGSPAYEEGAGAILKRDIKLLRDAGIEILGSACHGAGECYTHKFRNYEIYKEFDPLKNEGGSMAIPDFWKVSLEELDLKYEAYFTRPDYYLSDSHGKWYGIFVSKQWVMPFEKTMSLMTTDQMKSRELAKKQNGIGPYMSTNYARSIITKFNKGWHVDTKWEPAPKVLQLLTHPLHWRFV